MTDTEAVRRLFDELAPGYDQQLPFFADFGRDLVAWAGLRPGDAVLDVGAGRGAIAGPAREAVGPTGRVMAVDNAEEMLSRLRASCPGVATATMDAHRLTFAAGEFDVVTCGFLLHFLDDPERALAGIHRVLRPGGRLLFSGPPQAPVPPEIAQPDPRWDFLGELQAEMAERAAARGTAEPFTPPPRPLPELALAAGFTDVRTHLQVRTFRVRDPQQYWDWQMSHGYRGFVASLGDDAEEFRARVLAGLAPLHANGGIDLRFVIAFIGARRP